MLITTSQVALQKWGVPLHRYWITAWLLKSIQIGFVVAVLLVTQLTPVSADENFSTVVDTTYTVQSSGSTTVVHRFTITNKTPTTYLKEYSLQTINQTLQNVRVESDSESLSPEITTTADVTTLKLTFPNEVVGQGKSRVFSISYQVDGVAVAGGSVLELKLPKLASDEQFDTRNVTVVTPIAYGGPVRTSRQPSTTQSSTDTFTAVFSDLGAEELSLFYGEAQTFKMTLRYNLENPSSNTGIAQVALPPDTPYQTLQYHELDPLPTNMKRDPDGNWIATYELAPQTATTVYLTAFARLSLEPKASFPSLPVLPEHTKPQRYWESDAPVIQQKAAELKTAAAIFEDVVATLSYSHSIAGQATVERKGAVVAFADPESSICQEYADAFIATARAANIPARRLTGYAYTQDDQSRPSTLGGDILHAWAEYYDQTSNRWIPVDPTWQDTTGGVDYFSQFDLNHIVFAINGTSSVTPYPAGAYKTDANSKDVEVSFAETFPSATPELSSNLTPRTIFGVAIPGLYELTLTNQTGRAWYDIAVAYSVVQPNIELQGEVSAVPVLLPFQTLSVPVHLKNTNWAAFDSTPLTITTTVLEQTHTYETTVRSGPAYVTLIFDPRFLPYLGAGLVVSTLGAGSLLVFRRKR